MTVINTAPRKVEGGRCIVEWGVSLIIVEKKFKQREREHRAERNMSNPVSCEIILLSTAGGNVFEFFKLYGEEVLLSKELERPSFQVVSSSF